MWTCDDAMRGMAAPKFKAGPLGRVRDKYKEYSWITVLDMKRITTFGYDRIFYWISMDICGYAWITYMVLSWIYNLDKQGYFNMEMSGYEWI